MFIGIGIGEPLFCIIAMYEAAASLEVIIGLFKLIAVDGLGKGKLTGSLPPAELDSKVAFPAEDAD